MALQFHPLAFGVMLVVAAGTLAYSWWSSNREFQAHGTGGGNYNRHYDIPTRFPSGYDTRPERQSPRRRRKNIEKCCICLESLDNHVKILTCKHKFHPNCVERWLIEHDSRCPLCRKVNSSQHHDNSTGVPSGSDTREEREARSRRNIDKCCICLECLDDNVKMLICEHKFHHDCVSRWLIENGSSCPLCRKVNRQ